MQLSTSTNFALVPSFQFERRHGTRDSQLIARAHFSGLVAELAPHVIDDLWPMFWELVFAVCEEFGEDMIGEVANNRSGREVFDILHRLAWRENLVSISNSERANWPWRALFWTLQDLHKLDRDELAATFRSWSALPESPLRRGLKNWSKRWNLDADWCRDHALIVLLRFFFDKGLQDSFLHPHDPSPDPYLIPPKGETRIWIEEGKSVKGNPNNWPSIIWISVSQEPLNNLWEGGYSLESWQLNLNISRDMLTWDVFNSLEPERFIMDKFSHDGWNFLNESNTQFSRRVELSFTEFLDREESARLAFLRNEVASRGFDITEEEYITALSWRDRQLRRFRKALANYRKSMNEHKESFMKDAGLISVMRKPKLDQHLRLTIRYQIPNPSLATNPLVKLGKASAVSKTVDETLALIGLERRTPNRTGGRKPGSKNMYSPTALGR